jgi:cytochrome c oxidase assembly protein subunit 11
LVALTVAMVGATYASVPLYRMFCQATGFGGTVRRKTLEETLRDSENASPATKRACEDREVTISFNADVAEGVPWKFAPTQKRVRVKPGETALAFFTAKNMSTLPVVGVATYNVQPNKAGSYFNKVQCFCFEEQRLRAGEEVDMPVFFYLDPEFAADPAMADVNDVVLSYTFFRSDGFDETDEYAKQTGARTHGPGEAGLPEGIKTHAGLAK